MAVGDLRSLCSLLAAAAVGAGSAGQPPSSFDCDMRRLAYDFGRQLLPRQGQFGPLYYALNLNSPDCPGPSLGPADAPPLGSSDLPPLGALFVCAERGSDTAAGTEESPLRSVHEAARRIAAVGSHVGNKTIVLRGGMHFMASPLLLGPEHSGTILRSYPGEFAVLSGGKRVFPKWKPYNTTSGSNIHVADLKGEISNVPGLQLNGARATRARYPNLKGGIEVSPHFGGMVSGGAEWVTWTPPDFNRFGKVKYYTDMTPEHLRNNTPGSMFHKYMIGVGGLCSVYDPPVGYWCSQHPSGGGAFAFRTPSGVAASTRALPHSPYVDVSQMIWNVWRPRRWANWMFEVAHYDRETNNFTFGHGGFQGARGNDDGGSFFVENVFEELDNPGEFFFNESTGLLYFFYNGTGAPPDNMEVVVPTVRTLINITGTQWDPVKDISIEGVGFKSTRYTYMDPHGVPSAGDWALDRISAVFMQGTEGTKVSNSTFDRLDGNAVMISGYNRNATVQDCDFSYIGGNAIVSWGYTNETENAGFPYYTPLTNYPEAGVDGTDGNHPRYNHILRNSIREVGLYEKQSSFYMQAKTAQSTISGNVFFNGPRAGVNFNDGFGGGDELSHNLVFSTCRESGDHGPFNSWDRQPYLTTVRTGLPSMVMDWREIHHNFFIDNYSPQETVDNDDGSAFYRTHHNFLVYGGNGMKNDFGGHDNRHFDNVYAYIGHALGVTATLEGHEDYFYNNRVVLTGTDVGSPMCAGARTKMGKNQYFTPSGSLTECEKPLSEAQKEGMDAGSTVGKIPSDGEILGWAKGLLGIKTTASPASLLLV